MKRIMSSVLALLLIVGVVVRLSPFYYVSAEASPIITINYGNTTEKSKIDECVKQINTDIKDNVYLNVTGFAKNEYNVNWDYLKITYPSTNVCTIEINSAEYKKLTQEEKQSLMEIVLSDIQNSGMSTTNRNKIYNFIAKSDTATSNLVRQLSNDVNADFAEAYSLFQPFSGVLGTILGILALAIFVLLGLTVTIDLAYINLPAFQLFCMGATKEEKPKFVSIEAVNAVKESETKPEVSSGMAYFRMKTKQFIALGICLLYLVSGKLYVLIANIIDWFQGALPD